VLERNGGGAFVNVLSVYSWVAAPLITTYSASNAAACSFTNAARIKLRRQGTHVVGVHAGPVDTDMTAAIDLDKIPPAIVVAYADLRGIAVFQDDTYLPDRSLRARKAFVRDTPSVKRIYDQEGHAIAPVSVDIESQGTVIAAADLTFEVGRYEPRIPRR